MKKVQLSQKIFKNRRPFKLQTKLFIIYVVFSEVLILSFTLFFYQYVSPILINKEMDSLRTVTSYFKEQVDSVLQDLDTTSANINYSSLMSDKLDESFNLDIRDTNLPKLAELFVTINGTDVKSHQINLYDLKGNVVRVGMITNTIHVNPDSLDWFDKVMELDGLKYIGTPYLTSSYATNSSYSEWFISLYRTYSNPYGRKVGAIETIKRCKSIFKSIISYQKKKENDTKVYVFNENGTLVYPYDIPESEVNDIDDYFLAVNHLQKECEYTNPTTHQREHLIYETSSYSGWTFISVQLESVILEPVNRLLSWIGIIVGIIILLAVLISYYLSQNMVKPVKNLKKIIQQQEISNLGESKTDEYYTSYDELAEVYEAFNIMGEKLRHSMNELIDSRQQELKSRTLALQSQTNPHFFYNTLSNIITLAESSRNEEIIQLCRNITQIMRYISDTTVTRVTIREELKYVKKYLACMKVRYQSSLIFDIDVDEEIMDIMVPKLVVQPLVENAIKYGTDCIPPWEIKVIGRTDDKGWTLSVIDSGNGFSKKALDAIHKRIEFFNQNPGMPELKINGLGIMNVYIRWKIFTKNMMRFEFGNTEKNHGIITIGQFAEQPIKGGLS